MANHNVGDKVTVNFGNSFFVNAIILSVDSNEYLGYPYCAEILHTGVKFYFDLDKKTASKLISFS